MKLQDVDDGTIYATSGRTVLRETGDNSFEEIGRIPVPDDVRRAIRDRLTTTYPWKGAIESLVGTYQTTNLWTLSDGNVLATVGRYVFASRDGGRNWRPRQLLRPSSSRMGVLPCSVCTHDGDVFLAEYPLSESASPRVLRSEDGGWSWETFLELPEVRHFHSVASDPYGEDLWLTTGDRDEECRILRVRDDEVTLVGGGSQCWRAVELGFTRDAVLWGMDSPYADERSILKIPRDRFDEGDPERVGTLDSSAYYTRTVEVAGEEWVAISTAGEIGVDRTAPSEYETDPRAPASVFVASAGTGFTEWTRLAYYPRKTTPLDHLRNVSSPPRANAYVLLETAPGRGLLLNPINTARDDGRIREVPPRSFPPTRSRPEVTP